MALANSISVIITDCTIHRCCTVKDAAAEVNYSEELSQQFTVPPSLYFLTNT